MIRAAIVGLGWWGKTVVESAEGSDAIRFVAGATRTVTADTEAFAKKNGFKLEADYGAILADKNVDAVVLATPHSMHGAQVVAAAAAGKHVFCEKPFTLTKREAEEAVAAVNKAGVTLGLGYNRRLHPEIIKLREMIRTRRTRHHPPCRSDHDVSQRAVHQSGPLARRQARNAARRADADGRACGRRHDRSVRADRSRLCPEFPPRRADRCRRHHLDPVPHEGGHVGLSRHHDHDRSGLLLPGVRLQGLAAARRRHACRRRVVGRTPHQFVRHLQIPAGEGRGEGLASGEARCVARRARSLRQGGRGRPGLSDPLRSDDPRRRGDRSHRARRGSEKVEKVQ